MPPCDLPESCQKNLRVVIIPPELCDRHFKTDLSNDPKSFIDAPRRFLFRLKQPFIFLDADMIAVQNFDEVLDYLLPAATSSDNNSSPSRCSMNIQDSSILAVPNFRNKKKSYNSVGGNFNAGVMIVPNPMEQDYVTMTNMLAAGYNDTEEKLLNEVFRGRWRELPISYNCQKRSFKLAPTIWNAIRESELGIKVIHYVGGKPWQSAEDIQRLDWEGAPESIRVYEPIFQLWHLIRNSNSHVIYKGKDQDMVQDRTFHYEYNALRDPKHSLAAMIPSAPISLT